MSPFSGAAPTSDDFSIEPGRASELERCSCCGGVTRLVRGFVHRQDLARAVYLVRWTVGGAHDAEVAVSIGGWCEADPSPRELVSLLLRQLPSGPAFMVVDADPSRWDDTALLGVPLGADAVKARPLAREVYAILDAIAGQDARLSAWTLQASRAERPS